MSLSAQGQTMVSALVFSTLLWLSLILALRFCLKLLLSYHRWMFEQHGRVSNFTKVWVVSQVLLHGVTAPPCGRFAAKKGDFFFYFQKKGSSFISVFFCLFFLRTLWGCYQVGSLCCIVTKHPSLTFLFLLSKTL